MSRKKVLLLASLVVLALLAAFGCSLLQRDDLSTPAGTGWYIKLQIQAPGSKGITVTDFDVTGLQIQVLDPQDQVLKTIDWQVAEGLQVYLVPVQQLGEHEIEVTHFGKSDGESVQAKESAAFNIRAMKITVIDIVPGSIGVIQVEGGGEPPIPVNLTGYWDARVTLTGGVTSEPHLLYLKQTDSSLDGSEGLTGTVEGQVVTVTVATGDGSITAAGTIAPDGTIGGPYEGGGETGTFELRRSELDFGTFALSGIIGLDTDRGLASKSEDEIKYRLDFHVQAGTLQGSLSFWNVTSLAPGTYTVVPTYQGDPGPNQVGVWFFYESWENGPSGESGTLTLTRNDSTGASGSFAVQFEEGYSLTGSFELNPPYNGVVTITGGYWNEEEVPASTASGQVWHAGAEMDWGDCEIDYMDEDLNVGLNLYPWSGPIATGTFSVPDQLGVEVYQRFDDGSGFGTEATSGTLVITSYEEGAGIEGHFENMMFTSGTLSGSFDVSFELNGYN